MARGDAEVWLDVQVYGIRETMAELRDLDKNLFFAATREIKSAAKPLAATIESNFPGQAPISGMERGAWPWSARKPVEIRYGGRARRDRDSWPLVQIRTRDKQSALFDMAGKHPNRLGDALAERWGNPSRAMWRTSEQALRDATIAVRDAAEKVMRSMNRRLVQRGAR